MVTIKTGVYGIALALAGAFFVGLTAAGPPTIPKNSPTSLIPPWFAFSIGTKLHELFQFLAFVTEPPDAYIINLSTSYWKSEVAYALTKNKIIDCVEKETASGGTVSCQTVAEKLGLQSFVVCRYMESGMHLHLLAKDPLTKEYSLTSHGAFLTDNGDLHDFMLMINEEAVGSWRAVQTDLMKDGGKPGRNSGWDIAHGIDAWSLFAKNPEKAALFDGAMKSLNPGPTGAMLLDWTPPSEDATFCDIGGGIGSLTGEILNHYPKMNGIIFDHPHVAVRAEAHMESMGVADRAKVVGGNFFDEFPEDLMDCDVFNLRFIFHDWDDQSNVKILENIRGIAEKSTKDGKKVVVIQDQIIDTGARSFFEKAKSLMSLHMIANNPYGARERSVEEHADLFAAAGYKNGPTFVPMRTIMSIVEVEV